MYIREHSSTYRSVQKCLADDCMGAFVKISESGQWRSMRCPRCGMEVQEPLHHFSSVSLSGRPTRTTAKLAGKSHQASGYHSGNAARQVGAGNESIRFKRIMFYNSSRRQGGSRSIRKTMDLTLEAVIKVNFLSENAIWIGFQILASTSFDFSYIRADPLGYLGFECFPIESAVETVQSEVEPLGTAFCCLWPVSGGPHFVRFYVVSEGCLGAAAILGGRFLAVLGYDGDTAIPEWYSQLS
ncbi:hypothetical protein B0H66DRAFT_252615 [Apodospora peruviana]|uniref:Uncharacterized protein n=1 Tax=Apodospora peruviana TaxID=516989 RepID=A0AAE0M5R1_9PEZI|nr:hypothetical protein B0H66DRAFT_252615 [Apodospora peruviana]